jgi:phage-related protein
MIIEQLELAFDKIRQLPEERQAAAVQALEVIAAQDDSALSDSEIQGVKLAQQSVRRGEYASEEDVRSFFARFRA